MANFIMGEANFSKWMARTMTEIGSTAKSMARVSYILQMVPSTKDVGNSTSSMAKESWNYQTRIFTQATGRTAKGKELECRYCQMELLIRAIGTTIRKMDMGSSHGKAAKNILVTSRTMSSMELVCLVIRMARCIRANGKMAPITGTESDPIQMVTATKANSSTIK